MNEETYQEAEPFVLSAEDKYTQLEKAYVKQSLDFMSTLGQADELTDKLVRVSNQLKELQDAVMALDPVDCADTATTMNSDNQDAWWKLVELLEEQEVSDERTRI